MALFLVACATTPVQAPSVQTSGIEKDEGKTACETIAEMLTDNDMEALYGMVDTRIILQRVSDALDDPSISDGQRKGFMRGISKRLRNNMLSISDGKARWDMLKGRSDGGAYLCLVRTELNDAGLSYVEFEMRRYGDHLRIVDWLDLVRDARVSDSLSILSHDVGTMLKTRTSSSADVKKSMKEERRDFINFLLAVGRGNAERAIQAYEALPQRLKNKPVYAQMIVTIASEADDAQYRLALKNLEQRFGTEDRYSLMLVDLYITDQHYEKAIQAVQKFKKRIGNDPVLELLLAILERSRGHSEGFYAHSLQALEDNPAHVGTYNLLLEQLVADRHFDDAVLVLKVLTKLLEVSVDKQLLETSEEYRELRETAAYRTWKNSLM